MTMADPRLGHIQDAVKSIDECVNAYSEFRKNDEEWYWHKNVAGRAVAKKEEEPNYLLPSLEAIWMYLVASKAKGTSSLETMLPGEKLVEELAFVVGSAEEGFSAEPYLPLKVKPTDFVETAGRFLSVVAEATSNSYLMEVVSRHESGGAIIQGLMPAVRRAVKAIADAGHEVRPRCMCWAATRNAIFKKDADSPQNDLTHPYFSLCAISGLYDILKRSGPAVDFQTQERTDILDRLKVAISGLNVLFRGETNLFVDNLSYEKDDIIPTVFAVEAALRVWDEIEIAALRTNTRSAISRIVNDIGEDLGGLRLFDRDADFKFQAELAPSGKAAVGLDDHTTLGSVSNVLCLGLDRMPLAEITDAYYAVMDGCIGAVLDRRDRKTKVWKDKQAAIWYSSRAVEALAIYVGKRPIKERTVTARQLVGLIQNALQSEQVQDAIADFARQAIDESDTRAVVEDEE